MLHIDTALSLALTGFPSSASGIGVCDSLGARTVLAAHCLSERLVPTKLTTKLRTKFQRSPTVENPPCLCRKHCRKLRRPFGFCHMLYGPLERASLRLRGISTKLTTKFRTKFQRSFIAENPPDLRRKRCRKLDPMCRHAQKALNPFNQADGHSKVPNLRGLRNHCRGGVPEGRVGFDPPWETLHPAVSSR